MQLATKIPKWNNEYLEELKTLMAKLETIPDGPLRDYVLDDCFSIATAVLNKILAEGKVRGVEAQSPSKIRA